MTTRLYTGNLPYSVSDVELRAYFEDQGYSVEEAVVVEDSETRRSRGFGFVTLGTEEEAEKAVSELNDADFGGRRLQVSEARPKPARGGSRRRDD